MIKITYRIEKNIASIRIKGHAFFARPGKDIVCAGVSTLFYTLIHSTQCKRLKKWRKKVIYADYVTAAQKARFDMAIKGFELLAESYPRHVSVKKIKN